MSGSLWNCRRELITSNIRPAPTIEGTGITLQTDEDIAKWVAERKSKWPSSKRLAEKVCSSPVVTIYSKADDESRRLRRDKRPSLEAKCRIEVAVAVVGEADSARVEKIPLPGRKTGDVKDLILVPRIL